MIYDYGKEFKPISQGAKQRVYFVSECPRLFQPVTTNGDIVHRVILVPQLDTHEGKSHSLVVRDATVNAVWWSD